MTTYSLWSQAAETWSATGVSEGTAGIEISVSVAGTLAGLWLYSPSGESLTSLPTEIALYAVTGTTLVSSQTPSWSGAAGSGWVFAAFSSPPSLTASTDYMAVVFGAAGSFGYDSSFTWPVTSGPVTGVNGGYYNTGSSLAYPSSQQSGWNWWVDVSFTAAASPGSVPLIPPGITSPMAFRRHAYPSAAPVPAAPASATGTVSLSAQPGRARPGGAQPGNPGIQAVTAPQAPYTLLIPPGFASPMAFQRHAYPAPAPALAQSGDTGTGADTGAVTADVSDSDTGSGADASSTGVSGSDAGSGTDTGGIPGASFPLTPPGLSSPAAFRFQRWPSGAPPQVPSPDTGTGADSGTVTASASDSDAGTGTDSASLTTAASDTDVEAGADSAALTASITDTDTGAGADTASVTVTGAPPPPASAVLIPPAPFTPMTFAQQAFPSSAPVLTPAQDTGSGGDSGQPGATDTDAGSGTDTAQPTVIGSDTGTGADSATVGVSDTDAGSATDAATVGASDADTGSGAESSLQGPPVRAFPLIPPGRTSPMALRWQAFPTGAPLEVTGADTGAGADTGSAGAAVPSSGASSSAVPGRARPGAAQPGNPGAVTQPAVPATYALLVPPARFTPMSFRQAPARQPQASLVPVSGTDAGTAVDTGAVTATASDSDTGAGADTASVTVTAAPPSAAAMLVPPAPFTPMTFARQAWPSAAPALVTGQDTGSGGDSGQLQVTDTDAGAGADSGAVTAAVSGADSGSGADSASAGQLPGTGLPGTPPGFASPMAFRFQSWPTGAPQGAFAADTGTAAESAAVIISDTDVGGGTESAGGVPVIGAGTVWWLNPVRESMTGLDVSLYMSTALGAILQFASTGSERLYVMAAGPGVTLTVTDGGMVLDQAAQPFPPVALEAGMLYSFGPFHSVVQVPGTSTIQVALSTTYGVQVLVVQGPEAH